MILGILLLALGSWQCYSTNKYFKLLKTEGNENTSPFSMLALFSGYVFGIAFIIAGIVIIAS
ncbi:MULTISPECIES: hypothetical protein [unclassified Enterococcus]|uniref:hypothetical protein n=1 Tax=unclassified Enterococcus TaxID=2608891 RepID=UPI001552F2FD|nr:MULTISPECIES: hypothetical protein [unclassified Enterococcus]MBS7577107.1 hypothetical protein [Enterococcus sp. MMGLQ5-2]MBS7584446.1 hypothetical protein [Enterococcus sp. MMGLQ5-1]NPD12301.1 hypothetical protein [Enterococcus sp. MMGLQ5-1]NPD36941.1 hypothetical protein [Enterococcus sp. MMGLQ5-2]